MKAKIIELTPEFAQEDSDVFTDRMPLEDLKKIWGGNAEGYTDTQLYKIRDFSYVLCEVLYKIINRQQPKTIALSHEPITERKKSYTIRPCKYRRAS